MYSILEYLFFYVRLLITSDNLNFKTQGPIPRQASEAKVPTPLRVLAYQINIRFTYTYK